MTYTLPSMDNFEGEALMRSSQFIKCYDFVRFGEEFVGKSQKFKVPGSDRREVRLPWSRIGDPRKVIDSGWILESGTMNPANWYYS